MLSFVVLFGEYNRKKLEEDPTLYTIWIQTY